MGRLSDRTLLGGGHTIPLTISYPAPLPPHKFMRARPPRQHRPFVTHGAAALDLVSCDSVNIDEAWSRFALRCQSSTTHHARSATKLALPQSVELQPAERSNRRKLDLRRPKNPPSIEPVHRDGCGGPRVVRPMKSAPTGQALAQSTKATPCVRGRQNAVSRLTRIIHHSVRREDSVRSASSYGSASSWRSDRQSMQQDERHLSPSKIPLSRPYKCVECEFDSDFFTATPVAFPTSQSSRKEAEIFASVHIAARQSPRSHEFRPTSPNAGEAESRAIWTSLEKALGVHFTSDSSSSPVQKPIKAHVQQPHPPYAQQHQRSQSAVAVPQRVTSSRIPRLKHGMPLPSIAGLPDRYSSRRVMSGDTRVMPPNMSTPISWCGPTGSYLSGLNAVGSAARQRRIASAKCSSGM